MFNRLLGHLKEFLNLGYYVSKLDQFLAEYDRAHPKLSPSQQAEKEKYDRIFKLRDDAKAVPSKTVLWDKF